MLPARPLTREPCPSGTFHATGPLNSLTHYRELHASDLPIGVQAPAAPQPVGRQLLRHLRQQRPPHIPRCASHQASLACRPNARGTPSQLEPAPIPTLPRPAGCPAPAPGCYKITLMLVTGRPEAALVPRCTASGQVAPWNRACHGSDAPCALPAAASAGGSARGIKLAIEENRWGLANGLPPEVSWRLAGGTLSAGTSGTGGAAACAFHLPLP